MQSKIVVVSAEELSELISQAVKKEVEPMAKELQELRAMVNPPGLLLSIEQVSQLCSVSTKTARSWVTQGLIIRSKRVRLKIVDGISERYKIRWTDLQEFLRQFPSIALAYPHRKRLE